MTLISPDHPTLPASPSPLAPAGTHVPPGLDGIVVARTEVGDVRGDEGYFHYRGHDAAALAERHPVEDVWHLFHHGHLPEATRSADFAAQVAQLRTAPLDSAIELAAGAVAAGSGGVIDALRTVLSHHGAALGPWVDRPVEQVHSEALALIAPMPTIVAGIWRRSRGRAIAAPADGDLATAYLRMLLDAEPDPAAADAVRQYLCLTVDHGFNASTFVARCTASSGASMTGVLTAGIGSLSGPLHGGAPSLVLDMLDEIEADGEPQRWVQEHLAAGRRVMGFGHRIYRTDDPRAALLRRTATQHGGRRIELALEVEHLVLETLAERHPDRELRTNVEFYAAVALEQAGVPRELFTPTFAISRAIGWMAHAMEQIDGNRIVRPASEYVGPLR